MRDLSEKEIFNRSVRRTVIFVSGLWIIHFTLWILDIPPGIFGIYPRTIRGLAGLITGPLVHADIFHLISNSIPLLILGIGFLYFYDKLATEVFLWIYFTTGFWVWLLGREAWHIGASGLIYGIASFAFVSGLIRKNTRLLGLALIVLFLYGGLVYGLFPDKVHPEVSWESHLLGGLCGLVLAVYFRKRKVITDISEETDEDESGTENADSSGGNIKDKQYFSAPKSTKEGNFTYYFKPGRKKKDH